MSANRYLRSFTSEANGFGMILLLLLASARAPSDAAIAKAAEKCGLQPAQIIWSTDAAGRPHADITPHGDPDTLPFSKVECVMRWNAEHKAKIGFVAQPPEKSEPSR